MIIAIFNINGVFSRCQISERFRGIMPSNSDNPMRWCSHPRFKMKKLRLK